MKELLELEHRYVLQYLLMRMNLQTYHEPLCRNIYDELVGVEVRLKEIDCKIRELCRQSETCQCILIIPGVGELTAIVAVIPDAREFQNDRHMSA